MIKTFLIKKLFKKKYKRGKSTYMKDIHPGTHHGILYMISSLSLCSYSSSIAYCCTYVYQSIELIIIIIINYQFSYQSSLLLTISNPIMVKIPFLKRVIQIIPLTVHNFNSNFSLCITTW